MIESKGLLLAQGPVGDFAPKLAELTDEVLKEFTIWESNATALNPLPKDQKKP